MRFKVMSCYSDVRLYIISNSSLKSSEALNDLVKFIVKKEYDIECEVIYDQQGKPYIISSMGLFMSKSSWEEMSVVCLSKYRVGVDVQGKINLSELFSNNILKIAKLLKLECGKTTAEESVYASWAMIESYVKMYGGSVLDMVLNLIHFKDIETYIERLCLCQFINIRINGMFVAICIDKVPYSAC